MNTSVTSSSFSKKNTQLKIKQRTSMNISKIAELRKLTETKNNISSLDVSKATKLSKELLTKNTNNLTIATKTNKILANTKPKSQNYFTTKNSNSINNIFSEKKK